MEPLVKIIEEEAREEVQLTGLSISDSYVVKSGITFGASLEGGRALCKKIKPLHQRSELPVKGI